MHQLGFTYTELGADGWLPRDTAELTRLLAHHELDLLGGFVPLVLHRRGLERATRLSAINAARRLQAAGARFFVTAPVVSDDWAPRYDLTDQEWSHLCHMLDVVEDVCAQYDLAQVVHQHVGCVVETADEVERLLADTSVGLVLDSGHLAIGGFDPVELATQHRTRVELVHLKDTDLGIAERLNRGELTLMQAVQAGLFPPLGQGDLPIGSLVSTLEAGGYNGWYVLEQDCAITGTPPEAGDGPIVGVQESLTYLSTHLDR